MRLRTRCRRRCGCGPTTRHATRAAWLVTVATRRHVDARRSEAARHRREEAAYAAPWPATTEEGDDTLFLPFAAAIPTSRPPPRWR